MHGCPRSLGDGPGEGSCKRRLDSGPERRLDHALMASRGGSGEQGDTPTALTPKGAELPLVALVELVQGGAVRGTVRLAGGEIVVGASPECQLVVEDDAVSRRHLRLTLAPEGVQVEDLASRNGT